MKQRISTIYKHLKHAVAREDTKRNCALNARPKSSVAASAALVLAIFLTTVVSVATPKVVQAGSTCTGHASKWLSEAKEFFNGGCAGEQDPKHYSDGYRYLWG